MSLLSSSRYVYSAMATSLCDADTPFQNLNHLSASHVEFSEFRELLGENVYNEKFSQFGELQSRESDFAQWQNSAYTPPYGALEYRSHGQTGR